MIEELIISDCKLGSFISVILNGLGTASLKRLDISNNELGNFGARLLSKALQLNNTIEKLIFDRNQITLDGFMEIASGMRL